MDRSSTPTRPTFVPVAAGSRGCRGFETAPTRRLAALLGRYKAVRDDKAGDDALRAYAAEVVREIRNELNQRNGTGSGLAA